MTQPLLAPSFVPFEPDWKALLSARDENPFMHAGVELLKIAAGAVRLLTVQSIMDRWGATTRFEAAYWFALTRSRTKSSMTPATGAVVFNSV